MNLRAILLVGCIAFAGCKETGNSGQLAPAVPEASVEAEPQRIPTVAQVQNASQPLPRDEPLRESIQPLIERAKRGEARAACQLATNLDFCARSAIMKHNLDQTRQRIEGLPTTTTGKTDATSTLADLVTIQSEYCEGAPAVDPSERAQYWRQAAVGGHIPSMIRYASGLTFQSDEMLSTLPDLKRFKEDAPELMKAAGEAGSLEANLLLADAYNPMLGRPVIAPLLRQTVKPSGAEAMAYYMLSRDMLARGYALPREMRSQNVEGSIEQLRKIMSPEEIGSAMRIHQMLSAKLKGGFEAGDHSIALPEGYVAIPATDACEASSFLNR